MLAATLVSMWLVALADLVVSVAHVPPLPVLRSMTKPSSLLALSVHVRLTDVELVGLATRFVGAFGGGVTLVVAATAAIRAPALRDLGPLDQFTVKN